MFAINKVGLTNFGCDSGCSVDVDVNVDVDVSVDVGVDVGVDVDVGVGVDVDCFDDDGYKYENNIYFNGPYLNNQIITPIKPITNKIIKVINTGPPPVIIVSEKFIISII